MRPSARCKVDHGVLWNMTVLQRLKQRLSQNRLFLAAGLAFELGHEREVQEG